MPDDDLLIDGYEYTGIIIKSPDKNG